MLHFNLRHDYTWRWTSVATVTRGVPPFCCTRIRPPAQERRWARWRPGEGTTPGAWWRPRRWAGLWNSTSSSISSGRTWKAAQPLRSAQRTQHSTAAFLQPHIQMLLSFCFTNFFLDFENKFIHFLEKKLQSFQECCYCLWKNCDFILKHFLSFRISFVWLKCMTLFSKSPFLSVIFLPVAPDLCPRATCQGGKDLNIRSARNRTDNQLSIWPLFYFMPVGAWTNNLLTSPDHQLTTKWISFLCQNFHIANDGRNETKKTGSRWSPGAKWGYCNAQPIGRRVHPDPPTVLKSIHQRIAGAELAEPSFEFPAVWTEKGYKPQCWSHKLYSADLKVWLVNLPRSFQLPRALTEKILWEEIWSKVSLWCV